MNLKRMMVGPVLFDQANASGIITLKDPDGQKVIPMVTGLWETIAILNELNRVATPRPTTYEFIDNILSAAGATVKEVVIDKFEDDIFFATIILRIEDGIRYLDARPSNALAVAVRTGAPIWVEQTVYDQQAVNFGLDDGDSDDEDDGDDDNSFNDWLERIKPEDFLG